MVSTTTATAIGPSVGEATAGVVAATAAAESIDPLAVVAVVLIGGALLRLLWIGGSLFRLRRLRTAGERAPASADDDELQRTLGTRAEIRYLPELGQPVTFGVRAPVVLLPDSLRTHPAEIRRAVLCHELLHVQRRDWAWVLVEETVRAAFWFHPAMWWIVSRAQLAREEAVDELAILATRSRRTYIEALLAFADGTPLAAAPAFLRRRHLFRRILLISKETVMSPRRVAISCLVMACTMVAGSWYAVRAFPLRAAAQEVPAPQQAPADPAAAGDPLPQRLHVVIPAYPPELAGTSTSGTVIVRMTIDRSGRVAEANVEMVGVSGPPPSSAGSPPATVPADPPRRDSTAFVTAAQNAVRQWQYEPSANAPATIYVQFGFSPDRETQVLAHGASRATNGGFVASAWPPPDALVGPGPTRDALPAGTTVPIEGREPGGTATGGGGSITRPDRRRLVAGGSAATGAASVSAQTVGSPTQSPTPSAPTQGAAGQVTAPPPRSANPAPVRVGGNITAPRKIKDVGPAYPQEAQAANVQGIVILETLIDTSGRVESARVIRSVPLLDDAALEAVRQWEFTPTLLNGVPTPILMSVTVNFTMTSDGQAPATTEPAAQPVAGQPAVPLVGGRTPVRVGGSIPAPKKIKDVRPVYPAIARSARVSGIVIVEATIDQNGHVAGARVIRSVPLLDDAALGAVRQWEFTPTLLNGVPTPIVMSVTVNFTLASEQTTVAASGTPAPPLDGRTPIRVGGNIAAPRKIRDMRPVYPAEAIQERVTGIVIIEATIGTDGRVAGARVIRSVPLLDDAALNAVRQWQYTPTRLNGVLTPVVMSVTVPFTGAQR
jgi:protein TonB